VTPLTESPKENQEEEKTRRGIHIRHYLEVLYKVKGVQEPLISLKGV
ncbi:unnamed protein product, partial [Staurois parvus]